MQGKVKILVVDREAATLALIEPALVEMGIAAVCLTNGAEAAQRIQTEKFDGVFLDWTLPGLDGRELLHRIRTSPSNHQIPIGVMAGKRYTRAVAAARSHGVAFLLTKPFDTAGLRHMVLASQPAMAEEQRRYQRMYLSAPVECEWDDGWAAGQTVDVSSSGLLMRLGACPQPGMQVRVNFLLPELGGRLPVDACIARAGDSNQVAAQFDDASHERLKMLLALYGDRAQAVRVFAPSPPQATWRPVAIRSAAPAAPPAERAKAARKPSRVPAPQTAPGEVRVLIIDEVKQRRRLLGSMLERRGWRIEVAVSESDGLARLREPGWALVVADVSGNRLSGPLFEVLRELPGADARVQVLFLTGSKIDESVLEMMHKSGLPYLNRPVRLSELLEEVSALLLEAGAIRRPIRELNQAAPTLMDPVEWRESSFPQFPMFVPRDDYYFGYEEEIEEDKKPSKDDPPDSPSFPEGLL